ncbi:MAG: hypothetical protein AB9866_15105 [Syntrophobacteraceae bacterium]
MKYPDGKEVRVGDKVMLWEGCYGVVVASIDNGQYTPGYPEAEWDYLKAGILVDSDKAGLIHYLEPEKSLKLLERATREKEN